MPLTFPVIQSFNTIYTSPEGSTSKEGVFIATRHCLLNVVDVIFFFAQLVKFGIWAQSKHGLCSRNNAVKWTFQISIDLFRPSRSGHWPQVNIYGVKEDCCYRHLLEAQAVFWNSSLMSWSFTDIHYTVFSLSFMSALQFFRGIESLLFHSSNTVIFSSSFIVLVYF